MVLGIPHTTRINRILERYGEKLTKAQKTWNATFEALDHNISHQLYDPLEYEKTFHNNQFILRHQGFDKLCALEVCKGYLHRRRLYETLITAFCSTINGSNIHGGDKYVLLILTHLILSKFRFNVIEWDIEHSILEDFTYLLNQAIHRYIWTILMIPPKFQPYKDTSGLKPLNSDIVVYTAVKKWFSLYDREFIEDEYINPLGLTRSKALEMCEDLKIKRLKTPVTKKKTQYNTKRIQSNSIENKNY